MFLEPYQCLAIAGFIFLFAELKTLSTYCLTFAGSLFFSAIIAYLYPDLYWVQALTFIAFIPIVHFSIKPYLRGKK